MCTRIVLLLAISLSLAGCGSGRVVEGELPTVANPEQVTNVTVIRESSILGVTNSYYLALNDIVVFAIRSGEHTSFELASGRHEISVRCFGGWTPTLKRHRLVHEFRPKEKAYFLIAPGGSCATIVPIDGSEAADYIEDSDFVSFDGQS